MWTVHDRDSTMSVVCTAHLTQGQGLCLDKGDRKAQSVTGRLGASHPISHLVRMPPWGPCQGAAHQPRRKENEGCWRGDTGHRELGLPGNTHRRQGSHLRSLPWQQVWGPEVHAGRGLQTPPVTRPKAKQKPAHLTIVAPQVEVDSLWSVSVSAAVAGGEGHPNYAAPVASPPRSSACGTRASPSHSWGRGPSRTGRGCWSRCTGQAHAPPLHTYFFWKNRFT